MTKAWRTHAFAIAGLERGVAGVCAASTEDRARFYLVTTGGLLMGIDADAAGSVFFELQLPFTFSGPGTAHLCASADGRFVAVVPALGLNGALVDVSTGTVLKPLERDDYHANVSGWAVAMVRRNNRDVLICATAWNRLEAIELPSLRKLAPTSAETTLDFFYGALSPSPSGRFLTTGGWLWHPVGSLKIIDVDAWLGTGGAPAMTTQLMSEWWDVEVCWLDENRFALFGDASDGSEEFGEAMPYFNAQNGVALFNASPRKLARYLPDVTGRSLGTDGSTLYVLGDTTRAYSLAHATWAEPHAGPSDVWHRGARVALSCPQLHGLAGPCHLLWRPTELTRAVSPSVKAHAAELRGRVTPEGLLVLADALDESGADAELVAHCRERHLHGERCWVVEACW